MQSARAVVLKWAVLGDNIEARVTVDEQAGLCTTKELKRSQLQLKSSPKFVEIEAAGSLHDELCKLLIEIQAIVVEKRLKSLAAKVVSTNLQARAQGGAFGAAWHKDLATNAHWDSIFELASATVLQVDGGALQKDSEVVKSGLDSVKECFEIFGHEVFPQEYISALELYREAMATFHCAKFVFAFQVHGNKPVKLKTALTAEKGRVTAEVQPFVFPPIWAKVLRAIALKKD
jgi:hypothetical protein